MNPENKKLTLGSVTDVKPNTIHDESPKQNLTPTTVGTRISAHAIKWVWEYHGTTNRKPDKKTPMRGWTKRIYYWQGSTIILNVNRIEIYTRSRPYKSTEKMLFATWDKADRISRSFSKFAQIAISPIKTEHPADVSSAHLVINNKRINKELLPKDDKRRYIGRNAAYPNAVRVGAIEDGSHGGKVELVGPESAEGGLGLDWLLLSHPNEHKTLDERLEKIVIALEKLTDGMEQIKLRMDLEAKQ